MIVINETSLYSKFCALSMSIFDVQCAYTRPLKQKARHTHTCAWLYNIPIAHANDFVPAHHRQKAAAAELFKNTPAHSFPPGPLRFSLRARARALLSSILYLVYPALLFREPA